MLDRLTVNSLLCAEPRFMINQVGVKIVEPNFHEKTLTKMRRHIFRNPKKDIMQDVKLRDSMIEKGGVSI